MRIFRKNINQTAHPYSALAEIYDFVMSHVNYGAWASYIAEIANKHGHQVKVIMDIACGTGSLCDKLAQKGFWVMGSDLSRQMLKIALDKSAARMTALPLWCADMRHAAIKQKADMVVSLYDSVNYLVTFQDWARCLDSVYSILKENGLFVFDVSTLHNSKRFFRKYQLQEKNNRASYLRRSYFDKTRSTQINKFEIKLTSHPGLVYKEVHEQRIRPLDEIHEFISRSSFVLEGCYSGFSFMPGTEGSERVHFVLKKK